MNATKMEILAGTMFEDAVRSAQELAGQTKGTIEFRFNGVTVVIEGHTDPDLLYRDYLNSSYLGWETIGPDCLTVYPTSLQIRLDSQKIENQKLRDMERKQYLARHSR